MRLGNLYRPDRGREVRPRAHSIPDLVEVVRKIGLERLKVLPVHSRRAPTTFTVSRAVRGVRSGRRCFVPPHKPTGRRRRSCTRYVVVGHFTHRDVPGRNQFHFTGRIKPQTLRAGHYLLAAVPSTAGAVGTAASVLFRTVG